MVNEEHLSRVRIARQPLGQKVIAQALRLDCCFRSEQRSRSSVETSQIKA